MRFPTPGQQGHRCRIIQTNYVNINNQRDDHILDLEKIRNNADKALEVYWVKNIIYFVI